MTYDFSKLKKSLAGAEDWIKKEFSNIRTGQANPSILDAVRVESYGALVPVSQVGNITIEGARTIRITPWDMSQAKAVERRLVRPISACPFPSTTKASASIFPNSHPSAGQR